MSLVISAYLKKLKVCSVVKSAVVRPLHYMHAHAHKCLKLKRTNKTCLAKISMRISNNIKCTFLLNSYMQKLALKHREISYS